MVVLVPTSRTSPAPPLTAPRMSFASPSSSCGLQVAVAGLYVYVPPPEPETQSFVATPPLASPVSARKLSFTLAGGGTAVQGPVTEPCTSVSVNPTAQMSAADAPHTARRSGPPKEATLHAWETGSQATISPLLPTATVPASELHTAS